MPIFQLTGTLKTLECVSCSITFALTSTVEAELRRTLRPFQCPNGHAQSFKGALEEDKLRDEIKRLEDQIARRDVWLSEKSERITSILKQVNSLRGVITKMKNRGRS